MEYLTNSSGIALTFNQCEHYVVYQPIKPQLHRSYSAFGNADRTIQPTKANSAINYGSSYLLAAESNRQSLRSSSSLGGGSSRRRVGVPNYDPINDPHLRDYFERKFKLSSAKKTSKKKPKIPEGEKFVYKVKVRTGNLNNAGTDANVYITICGKRANLPRKRLFNKYDAVKLDGCVKYRFERNSTNVFKLNGLDIGELTHIIIEHDGKELRQSWFLLNVIVTHTNLNRSWVFECNDWLSNNYGLFKTKVQLEPTKTMEKYAQTDYEIVVVTGDKLAAGTDANVFITLYGMRNKVSQKMALKNDDSKDSFERNTTDVFVLKNVSHVGPLQKVLIEHDNNGKAPGWFLERVVVTDLKEPNVKYFCACSRWLSKDEDDGQISRMLEAKSDITSIKKIVKYKITVITGNKRNAGTDADVSVVLYGTQGDSGEWKLDDAKNNFERGQKDVFEIECPSVGEIKKIRIGHNNKGVSPGWFLSKVIVDDLEINRCYEFMCDRWLAQDEEDGKTSILLYPGVKSEKEAEPGVPYTVRVFTADVKNAGTSAKVFIELFGGRSGKETSTRMALQDGEFDRGKIDEFRIESPGMLSPLSQILIGHDNSGPGPGWFLEKVEVECPSIGMKQVFPCNEWLAKDEGDKRIERILLENKSLREQREAKNAWYVWVYTSDLKNAGTDANVFIVIYGEQGKTDEIALRNKSDNFETGQCDKFKVDASQIGRPFKIRVFHDNKGVAPGWHLDHIEMENMDTKERYYFRCNRWLSVDDEDGEIVRELPAEGGSIERPLPLVTYTVEVHTGEKTNAGTDADVFLNIFGEKLGDTGDRWLEKSQTHKNKFERANVDVFKIEAVCLKRLKKVVIGHNGKRAGAGWFLKKVVVKLEDNPKYDQVFECNRWLAVDEDDGLIVRELMVQGSQYLDNVSYHVKVKTGNKRNAGTDARVLLKIFGEFGDSGNVHLKNSENSTNKFEQGKIDEFRIEKEDLGKIEKIQIGHNGKGLGSGWFLDYIEIDVPSKGLRYMFPAHRWLDENEDDRKTEIEIYPSEVKKMPKLIPYVISIKTGDKRSAGTDANVFIQIYGAENKKTEEIPIRNRSDNFERNKEDVFKFEAEDVGPIQKVRIGHDNNGRNSGWFLEKFKIQRHALKKRKNSRGSSASIESELEEYFFIVNRWFAKDEDDGQIVRELVPTDENGRPLFDLDEVPYEVKVFTGDKFGAGTDANVFITIYGINGDSGERKLRNSNNLNKFEQGQVDVFAVKAVDLGVLHKILIRHDNSGSGSAWYLEKIEIFNPINKELYLFNCQNWLAKNEGDGKISRELPAIDPAMLKQVKFRPGTKDLKEQFLLETEALTTTYNIAVVTSDKKNAGTDARVWIHLFGENNDSGKIELETSRTNKNKFEQGKTDMFEFKLSSLGDLKKIKIGHDGRGMGSGWHLKEVVIDAPKLGKKWRFPCNRWLDKFEDDGKVERELFPMPLSNEEYIPFVPYEVVVYTSDKRNSDTSANPFIVLYGEELRTDKHFLCKSKTEKKDKFKRGAVDRFVLEMEDVGERINKIQIGHDNEGFGAGWHVDKVEIRRLKKNGRGSKIYVFPCGRWLAKDEEDRAIVRDLVCAKVIDERFQDGEVKSREREVRDRLEMKKYVVEVFTGNESGAGTNANVFLTIFGELGDSGEKELAKSETHTDKFERNKMDKFLIEAADLGRLFKVLVRHDNSGFSPDWFLDRVQISDGRDVFTFLCERWLSKKKEDQQIERVLFEKDYKGPKTTSVSSNSLKSNIGSQMVGSKSQMLIREKSPLDGRPDLPDGPTLTYNITIRTGDYKNCGNSAQVFIRLIGENKRAHTGRINLQLARKKKFEPGSAENFQIEALDVGELAQVELGHDGVGEGSTWFVKSIEINEPLKGRSYLISCNQWLSTEHADGLTIRKFLIDQGNTKISSFRGLIPYNLTIVTGDKAKAGTDSNVTLKFFGSKGASNEIFIEKMENRFERASEDNLPIELEEIGEMKKVRVSQDARGARKDWFLDRIVLSNKKTRKQFVFVCGEWLSKNKEISRGLSIDVPLFKDGEDTIVTTDYRISVKTSDLSGAGTDANVFVSLFGENGDSGELALKKSETNLNKFERSKVDVFSFKNILSLGELVKCRVWHDNTGSLIGNASWHLDSIKVEDLKSGRVFSFKCGKWLSLSKDDKQIMRELVVDGGSGGGGKSPDSARLGEKVTYELAVVTSDVPNAGTKHNAFIVLIGEGGRESKPKLLENTPERKILRRGQVDEFRFLTKSVGALKKIVLGHVWREDEPPPRTREELSQRWICEQVLVKDTSNGTEYFFPVNDAFVVNQEPKLYKCETKRESLANKTKSLKNIDYQVTVVTGKEKGAGTSANVFITIYGDNGDCGKRPLKKSFEPSSVENFMVECLDLGKLRKVQIEHDNSGFKKSWFLERIEVKNPETGEVTIFPCEKWLSRQKEDGEIMRVLYPMSTEPREEPRREVREEPRRDKSPLLDRSLERERGRPARREIDRQEEAMMERGGRGQRDAKMFGFDEPIGRNRREKTSFEERTSPFGGERDFYSRSPRHLR